MVGEACQHWWHYLLEVASYFLRRCVSAARCNLRVNAHGSQGYGGCRQSNQATIASMGLVYCICIVVAELPYLCHEISVSILAFPHLWSLAANIELVAIVVFTNY